MKDDAWLLVSSKCGLPYNYMLVDNFDTDMICVSNMSFLVLKRTFIWKLQQYMH